MGLGNQGGGGNAGNKRSNHNHEHRQLLALGATSAALAESVLTHSAVSYTDAINHNTTSGKNTVMITCVTGVEDIAGIVRPAGVYTFQPTLNNTVAVIVVNANGGEVIIDEL